MLVNGSAEPVGHTGVEKGQMDEAQKRNMFRHIKTEKFVCM